MQNNAIKKNCIGTFYLPVLCPRSDQSHTQFQFQKRMDCGIDFHIHPLTFFIALDARVPSVAPRQHQKLTFVAVLNTTRGQRVGGSSVSKRPTTGRWAGRIAVGDGNLEVLADGVLKGHLDLWRQKDKGL